MKGIVFISSSLINTLWYWPVHSTKITFTAFSCSQGSYSLILVFTPAIFICYFFLPNQTTHFHKSEGLEKQNILLARGGPVRRVNSFLRNWTDCLEYKVGVHFFSRLAVVITTVVACTVTVAFRAVYYDTWLLWLDHGMMQLWSFDWLSSSKWGENFFQGKKQWPPEKIVSWQN